MMMMMIYVEFAAWVS